MAQKGFAVLDTVAKITGRTERGIEQLGNFSAQHEQTYSAVISSLQNRKWWLTPFLMGGHESTAWAAPRQLGWGSLRWCVCVCVFVCVHFPFSRFALMFVT